ncbi:unnamed protein product [Rotaria sordida]|uniref:Uncharacterized protein n=1 Tax=Rotaria sordida TaxID=392033 RepID=A0A815UKZ2_9BILA|nr:unnamed protein product [Rotaria sordida]
MTDAQAVKFKIYFAKAIRENKTDLNKLYQRSWAIFKHHYSTDEQPMHEWCDLQWCKYLQATANGEKFNHHSQVCIPRACLDMIKPVFDELCTQNSLARVIGGGSQNTNESFHSLLWTIVPKNHYCSSIKLRIGLGLSTIIYNDGYESLNKLLKTIFSSMGHYSAERGKTSQAVATTTSISSSESDNENFHTVNEDNFDDISHNLTVFEQMESDQDEYDDNNDYEPGGDD